MRLPIRLLGRWIATVQVSDDDLNAYPEGDPIFAGLAMAGSAAAAGPAPASKPSTSASPAPSSSSGSSSSAQPTATKGAPAATATATPDTAVSTDIPIDLTIDTTSNNTFQAGDKFAVEIKTTKDFVCELSVKWPNDQEDNEDSKTADSRGRCRFNIDVPDGMPDGTAKVKGWSRSSGKYNRMDVDITIKNKS